MNLHFPTCFFNISGMTPANGNNYDPAAGQTPSLPGNGFALYASSRRAFMHEVRPLSRQTMSEDLQADAGRPVKSNVTPKLCPCGQNFIMGSRAGASKNICIFRENKLDFDLHNT